MGISGLKCCPTRDSSTTLKWPQPFENIAKLCKTFWSTAMGFKKIINLIKTQRSTICKATYSSRYGSYATPDTIFESWSLSWEGWVVLIWCSLESDTWLASQSGEGEHLLCGLGLGASIARFGVWGIYGGFVLSFKVREVKCEDGISNLHWEDAVGGEQSSPSVPLSKETLSLRPPAPLKTGTESRETIIFSLVCHVMPS